MAQSPSTNPAVSAPDRVPRHGLAGAVLLVVLVGLFVGSNFSGFLTPGSTSAGVPLSHPGLQRFTAGSPLNPTTGTAVVTAGPSAGPHSSGLARLVIPSRTAQLERLLPAPLGGSQLNAPPVRPSGASTASNWYLNSYAQPGTTIQVGPSNRSLANAAFDSADLLNISTGSTFYTTHGFVGVSVSSNGGATWTTNWPGQNAAWSTTGNVNYGDVLGGPVLNPDYTGGVDPNIITQFYGFTPVNPAIASTPTASSTVLVAPFIPYCFEYFTSACPVSTYATASGIAGVRSANGGTTWGAPIPIESQPFYHTYAVAACGNYPANTYIVPDVQVSSLGAAMSTYGDAYAAFSVTGFDYYGSTYLICNTTVTPNVLQYNWAGITFSTEVAVSINGGTSWGAPHTVAFFNWTGANLATGIPYNPLFDGVNVAIGPAPAETAYVTYSDLVNGTAFGNTAIGLVTTSNNGTSWTAAGDIPALLPNVVRASGSNWLYNFSTPVIAADNWSGSTYKGHLYLTWADNRTTTQVSGYPSIAFSSSSGAGWSSPTFLSPNTPTSTQYVDPSVSVGPTGTVWVSYYGSNPSNGNYHLFGAYSTDGGATWSDQFVISDTVSAPGSTTTAIPIYGATSIAATSAGAYVSWEDCRAANCALGGNATTYLALVHPVLITSNAAGISATVSVGGVQSVYPLPASTGWDTNLTVTVSVPNWVATPNGTYIEEFASFSGAVASASNPVSFTYAGGALTVHYVLTPGSWIIGSIRPMIPGARLTIVEISTSQAVAATLMPGTGQFTYNVTVPGSQSYTVTASAPKYQTQSQTVGTTNLKEKAANFTLVKTDGWIAGAISSSTGAAGLAVAVLTVNDTPVAFNKTTGRFNVTEAWGCFYVNLTSNPTSLYLGTKQNTCGTQVLPGTTSTLRLSLKGAWINGTITPYPVTVTINGVVVGLNVTGNTAQWVDALAGGTYTIAASQPGYSFFSTTYTVPAGTSLNLTGSKGIVLTDRGTIEGIIAPPSNNGHVPSLTINGATESILTTGSYSVSEPGSSKLYAMVVKLSGYDSAYRNVTVNPGNNTWVNITLNLTIQKGCQATNSCPPPTCQTNASLCVKTSTALSPLVYVGIGVIILLVVVIAAVMLMRRGKGGSGMPAPGAPMMGEAPPPQTPMELSPDGGTTEPPASP
ncbi:MAG: hypothetical protein L3J95_02070 [Thermoplasmata archaeon]|nr:hypothetical protein [Thermoplasmata archaeon]MCI4359198.1 hypothetical protein [Thermoplasmata archaeon]